MLKLPNPPWYRRWSFLLAGVIGLAAIVALLGWRGLQQASPSTTTTTAPPATVAPTTTTRPPPQSPTSTRAAAPGVLLQMEGSDTERSRLFKAPARWRIVWSFDCREFAGGGGGNFKISGEGAFDEELVQRFGRADEGVATVSGGGFGRLVVTSVCEHWEVQAVRA
jgi:hypothetical protein